MPPLSIMIKPASSLCNLRCKYCFYHDVAECRDVPSYGIMSEMTSDKLIKSALAFADGETVSFTFQGGEPLLAGISYFHHFVDTLKRENVHKSKIFLSVQTNGTLITDEWANFFRENDVLVGLSLDGDFDNNTFRIDEEGGNVFYKALKGSEILRKNGVEFNILTVLTGRCADNIDKIYSFFKSQNFGYLQFIPCLRPFGSTEENEFFMTTDQYYNFLKKCFLRYKKDWEKGKYTSIRYFDNLVLLARGKMPEQCGMCGHCSRQFVAESNGNIYPCDFYCTDEYLLGNINDADFADLAKSDKAERFIKDSLAIDENCRQCEYFSLCRGGGCKRTNESADYCDSYKRFFEECLPLLKQL